MPWYTAALQPVIDKVSPNQRKQAAQFLDACFNIFTKGIVEWTQTPGRDSELEFYFGVIEKAHKKFAGQDNVSFDDFAKYMLPLMIVYAKVAEDTIDIWNKDFIKEARQQKLYQVVPRNSSLSALLIRTINGELIHKNLRLSDFPIEVIEKLEAELELDGQAIPPRDFRLFELPSRLIIRLEKACTRYELERLERVVLKDLNHKTTIEPWDIVGILLNSEAVLPKDVEQYISNLHANWEQGLDEPKKSLTEEPKDLQEITELSEFDIKLKEIIKQSEQQPIIENLTEILEHYLDYSIKQDKKYPSPPFFQCDSVQNKVIAVENFIQALEGEHSFSKTDRDILKRDIGLMTLIKKLLKIDVYREKLENELNTQPYIKSLDRVSKLFNYLVFLSEPKDTAQDHRKLSQP